VVVKSHHHVNQSISVFNYLLWSLVTTDQLLTAENSGIFMAIRDRTALALVCLVIWLHGYLVLVKYFLC
jgi:hypothetical protein